MSTVAQIREELNAKAKQINEIIEPFGENDIPAETFNIVNGHLGELRDLKKRLEAAAAQNDARSEVGDLLKLLNDPTGGVRHPSPAGGQIKGSGRRGTLGQQVIGTDEWQAFLRQVAPGGKVSDGMRFQSPPTQVDSKQLMGLKALLTGASATSAGAMVVNDFMPELLVPGRRPNMIRDVITVAETNSDVVEYARVVSETNAAAPIAEATTQADGGKPESSVVFEAVTAPVKTIAHWIAATRRALSDAAQIRSYIDAFLTNGLEEELEDQIIAGSGTGQNFIGLLNTSGTQSQAWDTDILVTTRKARTKVRTVGRSTPTAYLFNPADWETIDLLTDAEDRYYFGGPAVMGTPRLWGLPVIESEAVPAGTGVVGDMRQMVLWDREDAQILVSDSHADFFIRNIIVILAELRAAFGILRPAAFVEIDLTAA